MKIKHTMGYQLRDYLRGTMVYYGIIYVLFLLMILLRSIVDINPARFTVSAMETSTMIFLFVMGLNAYKTNLKMFVQHGISRRTLVLSFIASAFCLSVLTALLDSLHPALFGKAFNYRSYYMLTYGKAYATYVGGLVWSIAANMAFLCIGFFITTLYYRMNKLLKVLVSVGVPGLVFIGLPLYGALSDSNIMITLYNFYLRVMGLTQGNINSYTAVGTYALLSAILLGLSWLLVRRAVVKEN